MTLPNWTREPLVHFVAFGALLFVAWKLATFRGLPNVLVTMSVLTIVYAVSGIAVNHINDWNPNYTFERVEQRFEHLDRNWTDAHGHSLHPQLAARVEAILRVPADEAEMRIGDVEMRIDAES